jgi:GAF domain-containing protein
MSIPADPAADSFLDVLASASLRLASADDEMLDAAIDHALGEIGRHEGADRAYVTLFADDDRFSNSHEWVATGVRSHREAIVDMRITDFPWSYAKVASGEVWHCPDVEELPPEAAAERASFGEFGVTSVLQVPMRNADRLIGVIGFNHVDRPRAWHPITIDRVRRIGDAIGFALLRREANRSVRHARDVAERANRAKDEFLSQVSHELVTPLHAILGFAELLDTPGRTEHERQAVQQIVGSGRHLLGLVEELLAVTTRASAAQPPIE